MDEGGELSDRSAAKSSITQTKPCEDASLRLFRLKTRMARLRIAVRTARSGRA
jgi:hypothetical protein